MSKFKKLTIKKLTVKKSTQLFIMMLSLSLASNAFAYKVGDTVDPQIIKKLGIQNNKVTIVDFFASWSTTCKKDLPILNKMKFDKSKVAVIGVGTDRRLTKGKAFQKKLKIKFPVYNDNNQNIVTRFAPTSMPALFYIKNGKVVKIRQGSLPKIDVVVRKDLARLLK